MKKTVWRFFLVLVLVLSLCLPSLAAGEYPISDEAGVLPEAELKQLNSQLQQVGKKWDLSLGVVLVEKVPEGVSAAEFARDLYSRYAYGPDGLLLMIATVSRDYALYASGEGKTAFTQYGRDRMAEQFVPLLVDNAFAEAIRTFTEQCDSFLQSAADGNPVDAPRGGFRVMNLVIAVGFGLVLALIVTGIMKSGMKTVQRKTEATGYVSQEAVHITRSRDIFLKQEVKKTPKPKPQEDTGTTEGKF